MSDHVKHCWSTPSLFRSLQKQPSSCFQPARLATRRAEEEAKQLVRDAIAAGIYNDLGSGSNIDICVISKNKLDFLRPYDVANKKGERFGRYKCEKGTTAVLTENVALLEIEVVDETVQTMDTS